jgi:hypothetical protein
MFWIIFAVAFWGFFHSFNSSYAVKEFVRRALGDGFMKFYRLAFNVFAVLTFLPIPLLLVALPSRLLYRVPVPIWADDDRRAGVLRRLFIHRLLSLWDLCISLACGSWMNIPANAIWL